MVITKREDVTKQGFCKILLLVLIQFLGGGRGKDGGRLFEFEWERVGRLFEAGLLLPFSAFRMGAYSRGGR